MKINLKNDCDIKGYNFYSYSYSYSLFKEYTYATYIYLQHDIINRSSLRYVVCSIYANTARSAIHKYIFQLSPLSTCFCNANEFR